MKPWTLITTALLLGGVAAWVTTKAVSQGPAEAEVTRVVMAAAEIPAGVQITPGNVKLVAWPKDQELPGSFADVKTVVGRVPKQPLVIGEPVLDAKLAAPGTTGGLSSVITPGKRAITVKVNEVVGVAGFALPGSYVDILVSTQPNGQEPFSRVVLQRVKVLAAAQDLVGDPGKPKTVDVVTLELTPDDAEKLDLARSVGSLSLVLRNDADHEPIRSRGALMGDLMVTPRAGSPAPRPVPATGRLAVDPKSKPVVVAEAAPSPGRTDPPRPESPHAVKKPKVAVIKGVNMAEVEF